MFRIAWRNLWRNRGRTLIALSAIALSYALFLFMMGVGDDQYAKLEVSAVRTAGGSILIHGDGYWDAQTQDIVIDDAATLLARLDEHPEVVTAVPRVLITGLIDSPYGSAGVRLSGIDPEREADVADLRPYLVEGTFLDGEEDSPIVLGQAIVDDLEVELGDRIVLTATDIEGEVTRALFRLSGIVDTGLGSLDQTVALTTIDAARSAMQMDDQLTQIGLVLSNDQMRHAIAETVRNALSDRADLEVLTWDEAIPDMLGYIEIDRAFNYLYTLIIFIVVAFGIANTFLMSVMERIRELGLLGAVGLSPHRIGLLVMIETMMLAIVAIIVGFLLGYGIHSWISAVGIDVSQYFGDAEMDISGVAFTDPVIRSVFVFKKWALAGLAVFGLVMLSALYPAWRATRLDPAEAMRTFE